MKLILIIVAACVLAAPALGGDRPQRNLVEKAITGTQYGYDLPEPWTIKNARCDRTNNVNLFKCFLRLQSPYDRHEKITRSHYIWVVSTDPFTVVFCKPGCRDR